ncbi:receptor-like kinase [Trifolium pratense]|uniref:Receptor-like kinase n=1 Tax=Trifolium pratense TaxID=57577 RepID=A0A2K3LZP1_TRIPR|nr:receptor-like kinase [Trifolium pratense]
MLKVDFERAYDTVNWNYLEYMMRRMGFAQGWLKWMRACIFSSSMSVLVNGSPTEDFSVGKGLRQGDPLSPFLFLIAAEGLTRMMQKAVDNSNFHGYKVSNELQYHTLQFADDTILIGEGGVEHGDWFKFKSNVSNVLGGVEHGDWFKFKSNINVSMLGNGSGLRFWHDICMGMWQDHKWAWLAATMDSTDRIRWKSNHAGTFTVKSAYEFLQKRDVSSTIDVIM